MQLPETVDIINALQICALYLYIISETFLEISLHVDGEVSWARVAVFALLACLHYQC